MFPSPPYSGNYTSPPTSTSTRNLGFGRQPTGTFFEGGDSPSQKESAICSDCDHGGHTQCRGRIDTILTHHGQVLAEYAMAFRLAEISDAMFAAYQAQGRVALQEGNQLLELSKRWGPDERIRVSTVVNNWGLGALRLFVLVFRARLTCMYVAGEAHCSTLLREMIGYISGKENAAHSAPSSRLTFTLSSPS